MAKESLQRELTDQEINDLLIKKEQAKKDAFLNEYQDLVAKYGYVMSAYVVIKSNGTFPQLEIVKA